MYMISFIVAAGENGVIGNRGKLPWNLPNDLKYFREKTKGHPVIMGRKTFESIGKPLPDRVNIVVTRLNLEGLAHRIKEPHKIESTLEGAIDVAAKLPGSDEIFIIGGAEIFGHAMDKASRIYFTKVHTYVEGDVFFPEPPSTLWKIVSREEHKADDKHAYDYDFLVYERKE